MSFNGRVRSHGRLLQNCVTRYSAFILLVVLICNGSFSAAARIPVEDTSAEKRLKVLLITGGCCHDYQNQKKLIREGLSKHCDNLDWTVLEYGSQRDLKIDVYKRSDWIKGYDLVIHNECYGGVEDPDFVNGIVRGHTVHKVPAIVIHCSMHSYRNSPAADQWRALLGVTSTRHERAKRSLHIESTKEGESFGLKRILRNGWDTPNGELYIIERVWPQTVVLADSYSDETCKREPVVWLNEHNGVKVFGISLGHHNETIEAESWQLMVSQGLRWAVDE